MRLGLIGDLHANPLALEAVLAALEKAGAEALLCLGDLVGYGPFPNETIARVRAAGIACVRGSADEKLASGARLGRSVGDVTLAWTHQVIDDAGLEFLRTLPVARRLPTPAGALCGFHGLPNDPAGRLDLSQDAAALGRVLTENGVRLVACGGSHIPFARALAEGWLVNPGSVGLSLNGEPGADYALLSFRRGEVDVSLCKVKYDVSAVAFDIVAWGLPEAVAETVRYGRPPPTR